MTINKSTSAEGEALLIQFDEPWLFPQKVTKCDFKIITETDDLFYYKEFRWSIDGFSFTDFIELGENKENLFALKMPNDKLFFLEFRFTQVGEGELLIDTFDVELQQNDGEFCANQKVTCCDANSVVQGLVFDNCGCGDNFNPYDLGNTFQIYQQLCGVVSNMFGFCVLYFKTEEDQKSRDVILKEYSLYNVSQYGTIKMLIPDNQLPSRDINYVPLGLDFPAQFEVHIVRSSFEQVFGAGARPQQHDYLYFEQYMNRMYEVDAVTQPDDVIFGSAYWRVSLVPYQKRTAVGFDNAEDLKVETEDIVTSIEDVFKEERKEEYKDTRKYNQYNTIGTNHDDYVRSYLNPDVIIDKEHINNGYTVIAKYNYNLASIPKSELAVTYKRGKAFEKSQYGYVNGAFSFFVNMQTKSTKKTVLNFASLDNNRTTLVAKYPVFDKIAQLRYESLLENDILKIDRRLYTVKNIEITDTEVRVNLYEQIPSEMKDFIAIKQIKSNTLLSYNDNFYVELYANNIVFNLFGNSYTSDYTLENEKWYEFIVNYNEMSGQFSVFVYETENATLKRVFKNTWSGITLKESTDGQWKLYGNECRFTNFRVWTAPIEEEQQSALIQQYVVNDNYLTTLIDNAAPELLLEKTK